MRTMAGTVETPAPMLEVATMSFSSQADGSARRGHCCRTIGSITDCPGMARGRLAKTSEKF
jgi:hypothetical protein